jgi:hypothetical protein
MVSLSVAYRFVIPRTSGAGLCSLIPQICTAVACTHDRRSAGTFTKFYSMSPVGFASMIFVDCTGFDRRTTICSTCEASPGRDPLPVI